MDFDRGWALITVQDDQAEKALAALLRQAGDRQWWRQGLFVITRVDLVSPTDGSPPYRLFVSVKADRGKLGDAFGFIMRFLQEEKINHPPTVNGYQAIKSFGIDW